MIITCPQCDTRYTVDGTKFPAAGRNVRCAKCGNVWHQLGPEPPQPDPEAEVVVEEPPPPPAHEPEPAPRPAAYVPPAPISIARHEFEAEDEPDAPAEAPPVRRRAASSIGVILGWVALIAVVLVIGWAGISFRDSVATWLPQTSSLYAAAGLPVNPQGIDLADVAYATQTEDGQVVLAVTGRIVNRSDHELTVPLVRVALIDMDRHELYHWTFVPGVSTLKPGESSKFRTRLSSPPSGTHNIEVRFARAGE
jgi:predicted Zn finger-like uncharacterized protein